MIKLLRGLAELFLGPSSTIPPQRFANTVTETPSFPRRLDHGREIVLPELAEVGPLSDVLDRSDGVVHCSVRSRRPTIAICEHVLQQLRSQVGKRPAESGGMLIGDREDPFFVRGFHFDPSGSASRAYYYPDYRALNHALKSRYEPRGLDMLGFAHSHPPGATAPSHDAGNNVGDMGYAAATLKTNPDLKVFLMPILLTIPDTGRFEILPYVVFRDNPGVPVQAEVWCVKADRV